VPVAYFVAAIVLAILVPRLETELTRPAFLSFNTDSARGYLSAIAAGMFAFTGIVFSMALLLVQFGSTAYSPRLAGWFFADRVVRHALGVFSGTIIFTVLSLLAIEANGTVPVSGISLLVALVAVLLSILFFFALIQRIARLQIASVLQMVGDRGREVIDELYREPAGDEPTDEGVGADGAGHYGERPLPAVSQTLHYAGGPAAVVVIDFRSLVRLAHAADAIIEVEYGVGDTLPDGAAVLAVRGSRRRIPNRRLRAAIVTGGERTIEQDPKYAIRLIADIAVKALSAAVNDPTTAIQALDQLDDLLRRLGTRDLDVGRVRDRHGAVRVIYPTPSWDDFLALAFDEIRMYGANSMQVARRLGALLADLEEVVPPDRRHAVRVHAERVRASIVRSFADEADRAEALVVDRQGLGLGRDPRD
jgi:uncharacterized membrane protein